METSQLELEKNRLRIRKKFREVLSAVDEAYDGVRDEVYREGVLSVKTKRLMSLAIALRAQCENCTLAQTTFSLDAGATVEEILETCAVVVAMSGTTGIAESLKVIELLEDLGKL